MFVYVYMMMADKWNYFTLSYCREYLGKQLEGASK